ncbi:substrate-binding domain-containing protein [Corynebacterium meridianum]|uniref:LacI family DNA-binding transcriptional regulator n=1 Tax=Corynebacterium meridianum TaxID=2765363 RepID=A0A934M4X2_9CORY|nr:LacI family DNA-binding transcriptional regulator [Corynebacterium meridianum]
MKSAPNRATMRDVAALAGVSVQTVSRVLNNSGPASEATRRQVEDAAAMLKYEVNLAARALASKQSKTTGLLVTGEIRHGVARLFSALESELASRGRHIVIATSPTDSPSSLRRAISYLHGTNPDGMVVLARTSDVLPIIAAKAQVPCTVIIAGRHETNRVSTVSIDQYDGAIAASQYVFDIGCTSPVYLTGDLRWQDAQVRLNGFRTVCAANDTEPDWLIGDSWSSASGYAMGQQLLSRGLPDAIVAGNDDIAIGAMHALYKAGISVPGDVSVVGFDDIPQAKFQNPSLTTVRQDFTALGRTALEELDRIIAGEPRRHRQLPSELVIRNSTRPLSDT